MTEAAANAPRTWYGHYHHTPLYIRILGGMVLGVVVGFGFVGLSAYFASQELPEAVEQVRVIAHSIEVPSKLVLRVLGALASPLILLAVMRALIHAEFPPGSGWRLAGLLVLNTIVAIMIGLLVANTLRPGKWIKTDPVRAQEAEAAGEDPATLDSQQLANEEKIKRAEKADPVNQILDSVPKSLVGPFSDGGSVIAVIMIAVAFGIALRKMKGDETADQVIKFLEVGFGVLLQLLHWIVDVIPLAVFGIVASIIGTGGLAKFVSLGGFIVAVLLALALQMVYYLVRIRFGCWAKPWDVLVGMRDALVMAFTTGSSTATMPVTYACLREKVGLRERSASLGSLVGANFNNDGTALYEAMAALFISQLLAKDLSFMQQVLVVITSVFASVGAAGIPEAGLVTMTLVFNAVGLETKYIALLLPVDWFLDRCRTAVNVMGDVNVSCMLEGHVRESVHDEPAAAELRNLIDDGGTIVEPPRPPKIDDGGTIVEPPGGFQPKG